MCAAAALRTGTWRTRYASATLNAVTMLAYSNVALFAHTPLQRVCG
jgi:hypothetical protein